MQKRGMKGGIEIEMPVTEIAADGEAAPAKRSFWKRQRKEARYMVRIAAQEGAI
jgi:hypothetical protein